MSGNNNEQQVGPFTTNTGVDVKEGVKAEAFKEDPGSKEIADEFTSGNNGPEFLPSTMPDTMEKLRKERTGSPYNGVVGTEGSVVISKLETKFGEGVIVSETPKSEQS